MTPGRLIVLVVVVVLSWAGGQAVLAGVRTVVDATRPPVLAL